MNYTIENGLLKVSVSEDGAELKHIIYMPEQCELMWQPDEKIWTGQSPVLFPIVGRLWQDKYSVGTLDFFTSEARICQKKPIRNERSCSEYALFYSETK